MLYEVITYLDIPVCTVRQPLAALGSTAAQLLFQFLSGEKPSQVNHVLGVDLVLR